MGRGLGRDKGARLWTNDGAIATLEFCQPSQGRRSISAWKPLGGGPSWVPGERSGGAAPGPPGHQGRNTEPEGRPGVASTDWGTAALPPEAAARWPTLLEMRQEGGTKLGALPTRGGIRPAVGAHPVGAAGSTGRYKTFGLHQDGGPKSRGGRPRLFPSYEEGPADGRGESGAEWTGPASLRMTEGVSRGFGRQTPLGSWASGGPAPPPLPQQGQPTGEAGGKPYPKEEEGGPPPPPAHHHQPNGGQRQGKEKSPPTREPGGSGPGAPRPGPAGGKREVQVLTGELNRRGLAYVWGLMGLPGSSARIMIDSGNLVGDVVSEEFAWQVNLAGESCQKEIETATAASKMQIIVRCYPVKL